MYRNGTSIDRRWLDWHYTLPSSYDMIDLDALLVCHHCRAPLALVETSRDRGKPTSILVALARRADLPAYLLIVPDTPLVFAHETEIWCRPIWPRDRMQKRTLGWWAATEHQIREVHNQSCSRKEIPHE